MTGAMLPMRGFPTPGSSLLLRRHFLQGGAALFGLTLPQVLRLRSASAAGAASNTHSSPTASATSVIFVQLGGGASHFETYDPKPDAPAEYRGAFDSIATSVPGVRVCELLPDQARIMQDLAIVRSVTHHEASHIALHMVETGYFLRNSANALKGEMPSLGAVISKAVGRRNGLPGYITLPRHQAYSNPLYLGEQHAPFEVNGDPNAADFRVPNLSLLAGITPERLDDRQALVRSLEQARRTLDRAGAAQAIDDFQRQAIELVAGERARQALNLEQESAAVRERYGRNAFGQRLLLARRLVEAGVPFVIVRTFDWDDHKDLAKNMSRRCPEFDRGIAALVSDLRERGRSREVLVAAMGEFGRSPRVNPDGGRDHWPAVMSVLLAGGGYRMGQVIGASDSKGAAVSAAPYAPQSVLAMVYRHLGIDPALTFNDHSGRPRYVLERRELIRELL